MELAAIKKRGAGVRGMNRSAADAYHINNPHEINKNIFRNRLGDNKMRQEAV